jgi:hypothetical protein
LAVFLRLDHEDSGFGKNSQRNSRPIAAESTGIDDLLWEKPRAPQIPQTLAKRDGSGADLQLFFPRLRDESQWVHSRVIGK